MGVIQSNSFVSSQKLWSGDRGIFSTLGSKEKPVSKGKHGR